ncbi:MAG: hypothetical protein LWW87_06985 [Geobacteraceae bacterium]|nr:hypothetical protein [Geobacteraceae bacterium]
MPSVAVLFARKTSYYKQLPGVDVYDIDRDAFTFLGGVPVVAHPPCRTWGKLSHMATSARPGEKELALFAIEQIRKNGGVLEHPKYSKLFKLLPPVGQYDSFGGFVLGVNQSWWGHNGEKPTLLYICGVPRNTVSLPLSLAYPLKSCESMCTAERERTPPAFARWLVDLAARCKGVL